MLASMLIVLAAATPAGGGETQDVAKNLWDNAPAMMIGFGVAFAGYLFLRSRAKPNRKPKRAQPRVAAGGDPLAGQARTQSLAQERAAERDMQALMVDFHQQTRDMNAALDTRLAKLEVLLTEADDKIARLEVLRGEAPEPREFNTEPATDAETGSGGDGGGGGGIGPLDRHREVYDLADAGHDATEIARQLGRPRGEVDLILALRP